MRAATAILLTLALLATAGAGGQPAPPGAREAFEVFHEDWESGGLGWTSVDRSGRPSDFHVSTYYAYDDGELPNYSYWCGTFEYDEDGGYGNGWNAILELPEIDVPNGRNPPRIRFRYRVFADNWHYESVDRAWLEVKHLGEYRVLWQVTGPDGGWVQTLPIDPQPFDDPLKLRFRFRSGCDRSDEDGYPNSIAGAFHVDEIRVNEFGTGVDLFYDDVEDGVGLCSAVDMPATGVVARLIELPCRAYSDPTCTTVTLPGDTTFVPPNLFCQSVSPPIHIGWADSCRIYYAGMNCGVGDVTDERIIQISVDGGSTWHRTAQNTWEEEEGVWCGEFSQWGLAGYDISGFLPASTLQLRFSLITDDDGIDVGGGGAAGSFIDDIWVAAWGWTAVPEEAISWSRIKALYGVERTEAEHASPPDKAMFR